MNGEKISRREFLAEAILLTTVAGGGLSFAAGRERKADGFAWLRSARIALAEGYVPPFYPQLRCSGERLAEVAARMGANVLRFPAISQFALYPTQHYPVHPELNGRDLLKETIAACHARGIKVIPYIAVNVSVWPADAGGDIKTWASVDAKGRPLHSSLFSLDKTGSYLTLCLLSPIQEKIKAYVAEITANYDVDGVYFDGPYPYMASMKCYCRFCREAYRKARGKDIPLQDSTLTAQAEREYFDWYSEDVARQLVRELAGIIRSRKNVPVIINLTPFLFARSYSESLYPEVDAFMFESRPGPLTNKMYNLLMGCSTGRTIWSYLSTPHLASTDHLRRRRLGSWYSFGVDEREVAMQGFAAIASGAAPIYWGLNNRYQGTGNLRPLQEPFEFLERHGSLIERMQTVPFVAILTSNRTVNWYRYRPGGESGYHPSFYYGAFSLLKDAHVQAEPLHESQLTAGRLRRYRALYLPNVACLSEPHSQLIREYVKGGGSLLASYETSLFDENGAPRKDFALADVFGAHWQESPDHWTDLFLRFEPGRQPQFYPAKTMIPQDPDVTIVAASDERSVLARTVHAARDQVLSAGLVVRRFGKGRAAYLSGSLEAVYYESRLAPVRELVAKLLPHLTVDAPPPYRLKAPEGVVAHLMSGRDELLLHVLCDVGNKWKAPVSREAYMPVPGIVADVRIPAGRKVKSVRLLRQDSRAAFRLQDGYASVALPPIELYESIHIELD